MNPATIARSWPAAASARAEHRRPELAVVYAVSLDDTSRLRPVAQFWTHSAQPWIVFGPEVPAYATQPEDPSVLVTLWQNALMRETEK